MAKLIFCEKFNGRKVPSDYDSKELYLLHQKAKGPFDIGHVIIRLEHRVSNELRLLRVHFANKEADQFFSHSFPCEKFGEAFVIDDQKKALDDVLEFCRVKELPLTMCAIYDFEQFR